jgi:hypothetical protein
LNLGDRAVAGAAKAPNAVRALVAAVGLADQAVRAEESLGELAAKEALYAFRWATHRRKRFWYSQPPSWEG